MKKISFIKSDDREYNIERCLSLIKSEIMTGLKSAKNIVIKPNCVSDSIKLSSTHVSALEAVLQFIQPLTNGEITVAEGTQNGKTMIAFKNFGYFSLQDKYGFAVCDLNTDDSVQIALQNDDGNLMELKIAKTVIEADYLISITPPKTHNSLLYSGAIENIATGCLIKKTYSEHPAIKFLHLFSKNDDFKSALLQNPRKANNNIAKIFRSIPISLAVIDGFESMEGNGPIEGEMMPSQFAIASSDPIAADWLASQKMGIELRKISYLESLVGDCARSYFVVGDDWQKNIRKFRLPDSFQ